MYSRLSISKRVYAYPKIHVAIFLLFFATSGNQAYFFLL